MKIIIGGRQTGKTTQLIKEAAKKDGVIVTNSSARANQLFWEARELGLDIRMPITLYDIMRTGLAGSFITSLYIDDAEKTLEALIARETHGRGQIEAITINLAELNNTMVMTSDGRGET